MNSTEFKEWFIESVADKFALGGAIILLAFVVWCFFASGFVGLP